MFGALYMYISDLRPKSSYQSFVGKKGEYVVSNFLLYAYYSKCISIISLMLKYIDSQEFIWAYLKDKREYFISEEYFNWLSIWLA